MGRRRRGHPEATCTNHTGRRRFCPQKSKTTWRFDRLHRQWSSDPKELELVFSSYVDRNGKVISSPVIVTSPGGNWSRSDDDFSKVAWAARLLFLAC